MWTLVKLVSRAADWGGDHAGAVGPKLDDRRQLASVRAPPGRPLDAATFPPSILSLGITLQVPTAPPGSHGGRGLGAADATVSGKLSHPDPLA